MCPAQLQLATAPPGPASHGGMCCGNDELCCGVLRRYAVTLDASGSALQQSLTASIIDGTGFVFAGAQMQDFFCEFVALSALRHTGRTYACHT